MPKWIKWFVGGSFVIAVSLGLASIVAGETWWISLLVNATTVVAWALGIFISVVAVAKGSVMKEAMGVSLKVYFTIVATTEILYAVGALMILSAMGINVMQHLANRDFWKFYEIISQFDMATIELIGALGWTGFVINRGTSFLSPGYLLIAGGEKLHPYFRVSAWTEILLEIATTILIFLSLWFK
jgi:hypothetical protein